MMLYTKSEILDYNYYRGGQVAYEILVALPVMVVFGRNGRVVTRAPYSWRDIARLLIEEV